MTIKIGWIGWFLQYQVPNRQLRRIGVPGSSRLAGVVLAVIGFFVVAFFITAALLWIYTRSLKLTVVALIVALLIWPTAALLVRAYSTDPAVVAIAGPALALATLFFVADGIQVVAAQANRAAGDVWWPTIMHFGSYGLVMIPLGWVLAHQMGVDGLVWAVIIASLVSGGLLTGRFLRVARRPLRV